MAKSKKKYVYFFGGGKADGEGTMKDLLGGKGAGLAEMTRAGVPVPRVVTSSRGLAGANPLGEPFMVVEAVEGETIAFGPGKADLLQRVALRGGFADHGNARHAWRRRRDEVPRRHAGQVAAELAAMPDVGTARADVALVFDYASAWAWATQPPTATSMRPPARAFASFSRRRRPTSE